MDGVLTDSEPAFYAAVNDTLARYGKHVPMDEYAEFIGMATPAMWEKMLARQGIVAGLDEVLEAYEVPLMKRLRQPRPALPRARETIELLRARNVPVGLCTASYRRWVDAILPSAGLAGLFDAISSADMVDRTKPDPAPYSLAAELLAVPAAACMAVEDSANGVASAVSAGMFVVQLRATDTAAPPQQAAHAVIQSLADLPIDLLQQPAA
jgi:HAD superfamily hydrolase (TIGR01509 family)